MHPSRYTSHRFIQALFIIMFTLISVSSYATHNRAGEIRFEQIGPLTIRVHVITYTRASSVDADRDSLIVQWGDGQSSVIGRTNGGGNGEVLGNDIKYNIYTGEHTYSGRGTYTISMTDPNRIGGILNVDPPNSIEIPFSISTTFTLLNTQFEGYNNSVILLHPPIDNACVGQRFVHIPSAYDPDGDSIAYELTTPRQAPGEVVPNYSLPNRILPGADNIISFDEETGIFEWDAPKLEGEYNIAFYVKEYRDGNLITQTIRDMQILVEKCDNRPPEFELPEELCVIAGERIEIPIIVTDPDIPEQKVKLEASGGPIERGAYLTVDSEYHEQPIHANLIWQTTCNDIAKEYYTIVVKAEDNGIRSGEQNREPKGLSTLKLLRIKVIGPPPENDSISIEQDRVKLTWDSPYDCEITEDEYFRGFTIWKSEGSISAPLDSCNLDLEAMGYHPIAFNIKDIENGRYTYTDVATDPGRTYCYRITGEFALTTPAGNPFNIVESLPSEERCIVMNRDLPALKNVSVINTDTENGKIYLRWMKPDIEALDTLKNPGPYAFSIQRSQGMGTSNYIDVPGSMTAFKGFASLNDTTFIDSLLNTTEFPHTYRVVFYTDGDESSPYGYSAGASSIFLDIASSDRENILSWDFAVPWYNFEYKIYAYDFLTETYNFIDSTTQKTYLDSGLVNEEEYCYLVEAKGSYGIPTIMDTLFNLSQVNCGIPIDTVAPCPPKFTINNVCTHPDIFSYEDLINEITWEFDENCRRTSDFDIIRIYYSTDSMDFHLIGEVSVDDNKYIHNPTDGLKGCYRFTAVDFNGNESAMTEAICMENCALYTLPNVFTPNGDGHNDIFKPRDNRFIDKINLKVFNRWGNQVFSTSNPEINWDGTLNNGKLVSPGTYYYICEVYGYGNSSQALDVLKGYLEIIY